MTLSSLIPLHFVFSFPVIYLTRSIVISEHNHKAVYSLNFGTGWVSQNLYSFLDASSMFLGAECWFVVNCFSCWPTISMVFCTPSSCSFDTLALASCDQKIHYISECIDGRTNTANFEPWDSSFKSHHILTVSSVGKAARTGRFDLQYC